MTAVHIQEDHEHTPVELALGQMVQQLQAMAAIEHDVNIMLRRALLSKMVEGEHILVDIADLDIEDAPAKAEFIKRIDENGKEHLDLVE